MDRRRATGSAPSVGRSFVESEEREGVLALKREIDELLERRPSEAEIDAWMDGLDAGPLPDITEFLVEIRERLDVALANRAGSNERRLAMLFRGALPWLGADSEGHRAQPFRRTADRTHHDEERRAVG